MRFLSTPSARRATAAAPMGCLCAKISIHALREEGDVRRTFPCTVTTRFLSTPSARRATPARTSMLWSWTNFYPRPPRGGRPKTQRQIWTQQPFLSTPSARRATHFVLRSGLPAQISIHALREEGDDYPGGNGIRLKGISIHALREEGDFFAFTNPLSIHNFYPRPPRGGRPARGYNVKEHRAISIHALREEGDLLRTSLPKTAVHFYPRPPRGGRLCANR